MTNSIEEWSTKKLTYRELFDAMIQNGYAKAKQTYALDGKYYCSLGQASMNLTGYPAIIGPRLHADNDDGELVWKFVTFLNDDTDLTPQQIGLLAYKVFKHILDEEIASMY